MQVYLLLSAVIVLASAQSKGGYTTPVPILKQIDKHNDDGSYSYGYENADGTYKIETKYNTGEVFGKYGYIDDRGQLREVEYGASKRGFEPTGTDVTVPPPTLNQAQYPLGPNDEDDGQYREDPAIYYNKDPNYVPTAPAEDAYAKTSFEMNYTPTVYGQPKPSYTQATYTPQIRPATYNAPAYNPPQTPAYTPPAPAYNPPAQTYNRPAPAYNPPAQTYNPPAPAYNPPQYNDYYNNRVNNPAPQFNYAPQMSNWNQAPQSYPGYSPNMFAGHPAQNVDIWTGSYTVNYR